MTVILVSDGVRPRGSGARRSSKRPPEAEAAVVVEQRMQCECCGRRGRWAGAVTSEGEYFGAWA